MGKNYFAGVLLLIVSWCNAQTINFPDPNFKARLLAAAPGLQIASGTAGIPGNPFVKIDANNASYIFVDTKPQTLTGDTKVKVLDKGFVTQKEYKKLTKSLSKYPSYALNGNNSFHLKTL